MIAATAELVERRDARARPARAERAAASTTSPRATRTRSGRAARRAHRPLPAPLLPRPRGGQPHLERAPLAARARTPSRAAATRRSSTPALAALARGAKRLLDEARAALGRAAAHGARRAGSRTGSTRSASQAREDEGALGPVPAVHLGEPVRLPLRQRSARCARGSRPRDRARAAVGSRGARLAPLLARRPHAGPGGVGLPGARGGVREARPRPEGAPRPARAARRRLRALAGPRRAARWQGEPQGAPHLRRAAPRRRPRSAAFLRARGRRARATGCCSRARTGRSGPSPTSASCAPARTAVPVDPQLSEARAREPLAHAPARSVALLSDDAAERQPGPRRARRGGGARARARRCSARRSRAGRRSPPVAGRARRPRLAHLHERHDRHAEGRDALAPELREPRREARRRPSTSAPATACSRCCRCTTPSSSPAGCSCRSRAARRSTTSTSSPPTARRGALGTGRVTAMIGVPALWPLLHRRITQELAAKPGVVEGAFERAHEGQRARCATRALG